MSGIELAALYLNISCQSILVKNHEFVNKIGMHARLTVTILHHFRCSFDDLHVALEKIGF